MTHRAILAAIFVLSVFHLFLPGSSSGPSRDAGGKGAPNSAARPLHHIPQAKGEINVDGYIDEKSWEDALVVDVNTEIFPGDNKEAPVRTDCLLLHDDRMLYVAFRAYDPAPHEIRAHLADRDTSWHDDLVAIIFDTFNDENRAFAFFSNPLGVQADEIFSDGGNAEDGSWDAIWESRGHINSAGYEVEMAIPFRSLQFQHSQGDQVWGFAPMRIYPRSQRLQIANFTHNRDNSCFLCQFHKLKGFSDTAPGKNIEIDPTITAFRTDARESSQDSLAKTDSKLDAGISGRWGITPNLTLSGTVNPDFSQVEADIAQLDINTQFALFYPEKRPFFLEGKDFFQTDIDAVYTRSVADPSWGVKFSGKEGPNAIGLFMCRDEMTNILFPGAEGSQSATLQQGAMTSVMRYRRDIGSSSTIGVLLTDREGTDYFNRLGGVDGLLRIGKSDTIRFQALGSSTRYPGHIAEQFDQNADTFSGYALNLSYQRQTRSLVFYADYTDFSPDFRADLGFIPQVNYRKGTISGNYLRWGKKGEFFSRFQAGGLLSYSQDHDGYLLEKDIQFHTEMEMPLQAMLLLWFGARQTHFNSISFNEEYLYGHFRIKPTGELFIKFDFSIGDKVDYQHARPGKDLFLVPSVDLNIGKNLLMRVSYSYSDFKVNEGRLFNAHLLQGRLVYHLSKRAFLRGIIQYQDIARNEELYGFPVNPRSKNLFNQFLFSYKINPRTVLFLGYSDNYQGQFEIPLEQLNRTFFLKIGYALSL